EPPAPDVEGMWAEIEKQHFNKSMPITSVTPLRAPWWNSGWMRVAAALVVGVGLGRISLAPMATSAASTPSVASVERSSAAPSVLPALNTPEANKYLGETVALLASLQSDARGASSDKQLVSGAADLLNTTRFLLDSPNSKNTNVRGLLEDLELVLAQVVQLSNKGTATDVELIHQAMEQRDVMPRLRNAVANNYSAE
ncbi:MAG: hypothetical protein ABI852_03520, partial [Gemmatimonadaceae bacterium]